MTNQFPLSPGAAPPAPTLQLLKPLHASGMRQLGFYASSGYWLLRDPGIDVAVEEAAGVFYVWLGEPTWPVHSWGGLLRRIRQLTGRWLPLTKP